MKKEDGAETNRRDFLKLAATTAPAAAVMAATAGEAAAEVEETAGNGLRKTAHVKAYLETARF